MVVEEEVMEVVDSSSARVDAGVSPASVVGEAAIIVVVVVTGAAAVVAVAPLPHAVATSAITPKIKSEVRIRGGYPGTACSSAP
jgi:hypothetical protein